MSLTVQGPGDNQPIGCGPKPNHRERGPGSKTGHYSDRPNEKLVHAWDPVLGGFRMLPYSLVVEDNRPDPANDRG